MSLYEVATRVRSEFKVRKERERFKVDPGAWAEYKLGYNMWQRQRDIGESIVRNPGTMVAAGHGVGKSMSMAALVCWWVDVYWDEDVFAATTAPSAAQLGIIWDYVRKFHATSKQRFEDGLIDAPLPGYVTGANQWKTDSGIVVSEGRKPPERAIDSAFQGRHAKYLLAVIDEAVGVPKGFIDAIGNMATAKHNRQVMIANPTDLTSAMYKEWVKSLNGESFWNTMSISVMDSPLIVDDPYVSKDEAVGMSGWEYVERAKMNYGEDSPQFKARVLGEWAQDSGDTVFTAEEIARAANTVVIPFEDKLPELGADIARMGADSSVVYVMEHGEVWETDDLTGKPVKPTGVEGKKLRRVAGWSKAPIVNGTDENPDTVSRVHDIAMNLGASVVKVDASGIGSTVVDGLVGKGPYVVVELFGGARPEEPRAYINQRAEQFFKLKVAMQEGTIDVEFSPDGNLQDELESLRYEMNEKRQIRIESKDSMRRRGAKSPDDLDGLVYASQNVDDVINPEPDKTAVQLNELEFDLSTASDYFI